MLVRLAVALGVTFLVFAFLRQFPSSEIAAAAEARGALSRLMINASRFFDFVLLLVAAGALAIIPTIMLYVTLQSRRSRN